MKCISIAMLMTIVSGGCLPRDISNEPRVRELGLIGRCLVLKTDMPLVQVGKPYPRLALQEEPLQPQCGGPAKRFGVVTAGTRLHVVRVERVRTYWDGLFSEEADVAFGKVDSGEHCGEIVDLGWGWPAPTALPRADESPEPYGECDHGPPNLPHGKAP